MQYFKRILKHYLILALEKQIRVDSDTHAELDGMFDDLETYIDARIAAAIAAHVAAENAELMTTVPGWAERMRGEVVGK